MSTNRRRTPNRREHHIRVRSVRREPADLRKLAGAIIALAQAQAEADAQADAGIAAQPPERPGPPSLGGAA